MFLRNVIKRNYYYKRLAAWIHQYSVKKNPQAEMNRYYHKFFGKDIDFDNPKNLIEKIYWLLLYSDTSLWSKCADKYAMREYINECGCEEYLPDNYGHWTDVNDIDLSSLPNEFVLKSNNGCGTVLVVKDKSQLDIKTTKKELKQWLKIPFGWGGAQLHYTDIKPCIIAEELLHQGDELNEISPGSMVDFKVWCFNGEPESVFVAYNRHDAMCINTALYDTEWNPLPQYLKNTKNDVYKDGVDFPKPKCLDEMFKVARKVSKPFLEVRVDFYIVNEKPVLGELTFTTGYGYFTDEYYEYLGSKILLPPKQYSNNPLNR